MAAVGSPPRYGHRIHDYYGNAMDIDDDDTPSEGQDQSTNVALDFAPVPKTPRDYFEAIPPFAGPYKSVFTTKPPPAGEVLDCLKNLNCSYFSSGVAPNLLLLKQHAQSLTVLIREMTVSQTPALIDNANAGMVGARPFNANESFDWLNDLTTPYTTDEKHHLQPLTSVLNIVEHSPVTGATRNICPLREVVDDGYLVQPHPWARHEDLIRHANEVLERLDHEYSARGGLLSIFPTNMQKSDREKAEKTVLGQMILWVQNLVQRIHHLERLYANAMDLLAKEAVVPTETLSALGTRGRKGREVVYPQDKFVLVNAGDDLWDFLNAEFERKEVIDTRVDKNYRDLGTTGEAIWAERGGREFAKGITCIDVYTRYYRLRDNPLKTVFVIPAYEIHPGTKVTRDMEQQPTVVSVVKPVWPERMSVLETKHKSDMADLKRFRHEARETELKIDRHQQEVLLLSDVNERLKQEKRVLAKQAEDALNALKQHPNQFKLQVHAELGRAGAAREEAARLRGIYERQIADTKAALDKAQADAAEAQAAREAQVQVLAAREAEKMKEWAKKTRELHIHGANIERAAQETVPVLKKVWLKQITESQILIELLHSKEAREALEDVVIPDHVMKLGEDRAKALYDAVAGKIPDVVPMMDLDSSNSDSYVSDGEDSRAGGGGGGRGHHQGGIGQAPSRPSWRAPREESLSSSDSVLSSRRGDPRDVHFDELSKKPTGTPESLQSIRSGYSRLSGIHGDLQNTQDVELGQKPAQRTPSNGRGSGSSTRTHHQGSHTTPKTVTFSPTLQGPTGSGASKRPAGEQQMGLNKRQKMASSLQTPPQPTTREGGNGSRRGRRRRRGRRGAMAEIADTYMELTERKRAEAEQNDEDDDG